MEIGKIGGAERDEGAGGRTRKGVCGADGVPRLFFVGWVGVVEAWCSTFRLSRISVNDDVRVFTLLTSLICYHCSSLDYLNLFGVKTIELFLFFSNFSKCID